MYLRRLNNNINIKERFNLASSFFVMQVLWWLVTVNYVFYLFLRSNNVFIYRTIPFTL